MDNGVQVSDGTRGVGNRLIAVSADACLAYLRLHTMWLESAAFLGRLRRHSIAECSSQPHGIAIMCDALCRSAPVVDLHTGRRLPVRKFVALPGGGESTELAGWLAWMQQSAGLARLVVKTKMLVQKVDNDYARLLTLAMERCTPLDARPAKAQATDIVQFVRRLVIACLNADCVYSDVQWSHIMRDSKGGLVLVSLDNEFARPGQQFLPQNLKHRTLLGTVMGIEYTDVSMTMATHNTMMYTAVDYMHTLLTPLWIEHAGTNLFDTSALADIFMSARREHRGVHSAFELICSIFINTLELVPSSST